MPIAKQGRRFFCKLLVFLLLLTTFSPIYPAGRVAAEPISEYKVKAVYLYKFLLFVDWPKKAFKGNEDKITIGILGVDPFGDMFKEVQGSMVNERKLVIKRFGPESSVESFKECQVLFISSLLRKETDGLIKSMAGLPILTVSEMNDFIDKGGIINFIMKKGFVRFEINNGAAKQAGLRFSSKLLRLADKVVEANDDQ